MPSSDETLNTLYGPLRVPAWPDDLIIRSLGQLGEWAGAETALAAAMLRPGEVLWDAGAFVGTFALGVAAITQPGRVVAIEANPEISPILQHNVALLRCPSQVLSYGIAQQSGWLVAAREDPENHGATTYRFYDKRPSDASTVPCRTLAQLRESCGDYDMLKLDLEGMERCALRSDVPYLRQRQPVIWAECNETMESLELFGALKWLQYEVLYLAFPAFRQANFRGATDLIYPMAYEAALVAGPADRLDALTSSVSDLVPGEDILCRRIDRAFDLRRALFDTPRWSRTEWVAMSRAELIARLGRITKEVTLVEFLNDSSKNG